VTTSTAAPGTVRKEVGGFLIIGVLAVVIDFALFNGLLVLGWKVWSSNAVALFVSMTFAFVGNYKWTFAHREVKSLLHAYSAFAGINLAAVVFIELVVVATEILAAPGALWLNIVKAVATAIATVGRFFAYKKWVFF
jgi:putative flippase GtrA